MTARVYFSNIVAAWPTERQEKLAAEKVPGWPRVEVYREDVAPRHRKSHASDALVERNNALLRKTGRRGARETIYVASLALLAWELRDFQRCLVAAEARGATVVALDTGTEIPPDANRKALADAGDEFLSRRKSVATEGARGTGGGKIAGARRAAQAAAKAEPFRDRWKRKDDSTPKLLNEMGLSYNTACKYLGKRPEAQRAFELGEQQTERNRARRKA